MVGEIEFNEWTDEDDDELGPSPPTSALERLEETKRKTYEALKRKWAREASNPRRKPERLMRYTITIDCTWSELQAIRSAIKGYAPGRKTCHQSEIPQFTKVDEVAKPEQA